MREDYLYPSNDIESPLDSTKEELDTLYDDIVNEKDKNIETPHEDM